MDTDLSQWITEQQNKRSEGLDRMSSLEIVQAMNAEDRRVPASIQPVLPDIADIVDQMVLTIEAGGRIFYIGAGTSGRLGVLDASECPPTFGTDPDLFQGIIAGGDRALRFAVEGAEDSPEQGAVDLNRHRFGPSDFLVGISASGRTPYVAGGLSHARSMGAGTAVITCNPGSPLGKLADRAIEVNTGPEILTGSTRLKAGTAQKMILNMLSTATMVRLGKTFRNLMVDLQPTNQKLRDRSLRIIRLATGAERSEAERALRLCDGETKTAIVMLLAGVDSDEARRRLQQASGRVRNALDITD